MPRIFISYRRDDTAGYAGRLHERLSDYFGSDQVFMDIDDIPPGSDFATTIHSRVANCEIVLALIGPEWIGPSDSIGARRIDSKSDFVRQELEQALASKSRLIPLLVRKAVMPSERDLPAALAGLARLQAMDLSDEHWQEDVDRLVQVIDRGASFARRRRLHLGVALIGLTVAGALGWFALLRNSEVDIAGTWEAEVLYDWGDRYIERFRFERLGTRLLGTASFLGVDRPIVEATVDGSTVRFQTVSEEIAGDTRRSLTHTYQGIVEGNEIRLTMEIRGSTSAQPPVRVNAKRRP